MVHKLKISLSKLRRGTNKIIDQSIKSTRPSTMKQAEGIAPAPKRRRLRD